MPILSFSQEDFLTFFAVLVRFSVLFAVIPFLGHILVPLPVKVLLGLVTTSILYPVLVTTGQVDPQSAAVWGATGFGIAKVVFSEALFGLAVAFVAKILFDALHIAGDFAGTLMGFSAANMFDPNQESQTQVISKVLTALGMLLFLVLDGHHLLLNGVMTSYQVVGMGSASISGGFVEKLVGTAAETIRIGLQLSAPMAVSTFAINIVYGVLARAMPQLNVLVLSFSVSALVGLFVIYVSLPEVYSISADVFSTMGVRMNEVMSTMR